MHCTGRWAGSGKKSLAFRRSAGRVHSDTAFCTESAPGRTGQTPNMPPYHDAFRQRNHIGRFFAKLIQSGRIATI